MVIQMSTSVTVIYKVLSSIFDLNSYGNYIISITFFLSAPVVASIPLSFAPEFLALRKASLSSSKALFSILINVTVMSAHK